MLNKNLILLFTVVIFLIGCSDEYSNELERKKLIPQLNPKIPDNYNILVSIVDDKGVSFQARSLSWDFVEDNSPNKFEIACEYDTCFQWEIGFEVEGHIKIRSWGYIDTSKYCSDHYEAETQVAANPSEKQDIELTVQYQATSCV